MLLARIVRTALPLLTLLSACVPTFHPFSLPPVRDTATRNELARHAVFVNNDGEGVEPRVARFGKTLDQPGQYERYVSSIMDGIRSHADSGYPNVLIRIHGGLNSFRESQQVVTEMDSAIKADTAAKIYPLFINWESGILESYADHLFYVRQGRRGPIGVLTSPFFLLADFGRALTRLPIVLAGQASRALACAGTQDVPPRPDSSTSTPFAASRQLALRNYLALNDCVIIGAFEDSVYAFDESLAAKGSTDSAGVPRVPLASRFAYHRSRGEQIQFYLASAPLDFIPTRTWVSLARSIGRHRFDPFAPVITRKTQNRRGRFGTDLLNGLSWLPIKAIGLMVLDAIGTPAFENMRRRTKTMFQQPYSSNPFTAEGARPPRPGAVAILFDSLQALQTAPRPNGRAAYEISLVGHSMGAIVANEALRTHDSLEVKNVVYMAGALSLREFQTGTLPYMQRHPSTEFFNLTLHPLSDIRETMLWGIVPSGSLLIWLDGYLAHPESELDRVMGKYVNTTESSSIFKGSVRTRIHLKAFGYRDGTGCGKHGLPYKHAQFNWLGVPYWDVRFWNPGEACP
ncbi:MAG: hypothetical protein ABI469_11195, partial [Gemmatimonadales bacterium]